MRRNIYKITCLSYELKECRFLYCYLRTEFSAEGMAIIYINTVVVCLLVCPTWRPGNKQQKPQKQRRPVCTTTHCHITRGSG
jgi:hypothetical protein